MYRPCALGVSQRCNVSSVVGASTVRTCACHIVGSDSCTHANRQRAILKSVIRPRERERGAPGPVPAGGSAPTRLPGRPALPVAVPHAHRHHTWRRCFHCSLPASAAGRARSLTSTARTGPARRCCRAAGSPSSASGEGRLRVPDRGARGLDGYDMDHMIYIYEFTFWVYNSP